MDNEDNVPIGCELYAGEGESLCGDCPKNKFHPPKMPRLAGDNAGRFYKLAHRTNVSTVFPNPDSYVSEDLTISP